MTLAPIIIPCPTCGSSTDVSYSCTPNCCFNHVCGKCYTTFETQTDLAGELQVEIGLLPPDPDPTSPAAPCVRCGEWRLFAILDDHALQGLLVCASCKALLKLDLCEVSPG